MSRVWGSRAAMRIRALSTRIWHFCRAVSLSWVSAPATASNWRITAGSDSATTALASAGMNGSSSCRGERATGCFATGGGPATVDGAAGRGRTSPTTAAASRPGPRLLNDMASTTRARASARTAKRSTPEPWAGLSAGRCRSARVCQAKGIEGKTSKPARTINHQGAPSRRRLATGNRAPSTATTRQGTSNHGLGRARPGSLGDGSVMFGSCCPPRSGNTKLSLALGCCQAKIR